ncbi:rhodanese-like domain-containing protein [Lacinutrix sp. Hel_I_90]|uniref:rhodanese-like domain-containing protein n=1 Tax=Lacinutrix sp. Hel_I_90 TaxID=1249999 RepID=UPI0005CB0D4E|nr:rhodanese-like domain-containing protein [Lacinutrix sp. Hel_I_90]
MKHLFLLLFSFISVEAIAQKTLDALLKQHNTNEVPYISVEALAMPKTKAIIFDSREPQEYAVSHLKEAVFVGYNTFNIDSIQEKYPDKNEKIVVYCSLGIRSETTGKKLKKAGYTNVYNLYGGIFEWKNKGFSLIDSEAKETEKVHTFNKAWSKWLKNGEKIYETEDTKK